MKVKIKKLSPNAVIPAYAKPGDAGMDLTAISVSFDKNLGVIIYGTGLSVEIPDGHVGLLFPRSSIYKTVQTLTNSVGVIDSQFRGEIKFIFRDAFSPIEDPKDRWNRFNSDFYNIGDRIGQLIIIPYPSIEFEEVEELSETVRGEGGFGSTGN